MTERRRRRTDRRWLPERWYRDVWLVIITGLVVVALANISSTTHQVRDNQRSTTRALCAFQSDLRRRYDSGVQYLYEHPHGILGIPAATIRVSLQNEASTLKALRPLVC